MPAKPPQDIAYIVIFERRDDAEQRLTMTVLIPVLKKEMRTRAPINRAIGAAHQKLRDHGNDMSKYVLQDCYQRKETTT